jgi:antitoxin component HigA of HigAB toxin-antitoxin module
MNWTRQQMFCENFSDKSSTRAGLSIATLTDPIEVYEDVAHPIPDAAPAAVLGFLMESNEITGSELSQKTGISHSTISAILHGDRTQLHDWDGYRPRL